MKISTAILSEYTELVAEIRQLEEKRKALKLAVQAILEPVGTVELPEAQLTWSQPFKTNVDLTILNRETSPYLYRRLTRRVADLDAVRAAIKLGKLPEPAKTAVTYEPDTPRVVITPRVAA